MSAKDRIVESYFECPKCGTHRAPWGSGVVDTKGRLKRTCHVPLCGFEWHERDDWKHFVFVVRPTRKEAAKFDAQERREKERVWRKAKWVAFGDSKPPKKGFAPKVLGKLGAS